MGVAAILKQILSSTDKKGKPHKIGQSSVCQIIAGHRKESKAAAA